MILFADDFFLKIELDQTFGNQQKQIFLILV